MSFGTGNLAYAEIRREGRDDVHYRAKAFGPDARPHTLLIVNLSPHGLMARCDSDFQPGDRLRVNLPVVGVTVAEVRWSLGGRVGCQFDHAIDLAGYYELIAVVLKSNRP
ncbi:PilZ domain-containing protein [Sphingomonas sp. AOB5]|uniref:PilZ domain-containing protein n=1 Tax=Sphingomonas sp. AOB5 TaxID=3034017 RepID=UPI0023F8C99C|nr:PilZ domain-containing protein [Sphingomonas sp. AOB5]MDF7777125.1 PilZ domain-containing protein [Sphingomonas sp. AOB5]